MGNSKPPTTRCCPGRKDIHDHNQMYQDLQESAGEPGTLRVPRKFKRGGRSGILKTSLLYCMVTRWLDFNPCFIIPKMYGNRLIDFFRPLLSSPFSKLGIILPTTGLPRVVDRVSGGSQDSCPSVYTPV